MKIAVLISGRGTNLQALIGAANGPDYPAKIVLVVSNVAGAPGLKRAEAAGIPTVVHSHKDFADRADFEAALHDSLEAADVDLICLAGFMRLLTPEFVNKWRDRIINIHPSLLPSFKGLDTHVRAIEAGVCFSGCTVHFVRAEMDEGPILAQAAVPIHPDDTPDTLAARVLKEENKLYPAAVKMIAAGKTRIQGQKVIYHENFGLGNSLTNPPII